MRVASPPPPKSRAIARERSAGKVTQRTSGHVSSVRTPPRARNAVAPQAPTLPSTTAQSVVKGPCMPTGVAGTGRVLRGSKPDSRLNSHAVELSCSSSEDEQPHESTVTAIPGLHSNDVFAGASSDHSGHCNVSDAANVEDHKHGSNAATSQPSTPPPAARRGAVRVTARRAGPAAPAALPDSQQSSTQAIASGSNQGSAAPTLAEQRQRAALAAVAQHSGPQAAPAWLAKRGMQQQQQAGDRLVDEGSVQQQGQPSVHTGAPPHPGTGHADNRSAQQTGTGRMVSEPQVQVPAPHQQQVQQTMPAVNSTSSTSPSKHTQQNKKRWWGQLHAVVLLLALAAPLAGMLLQRSVAGSTSLNFSGDGSQWQQYLGPVLGGWQPAARQAGRAQQHGSALVTGSIQGHRPLPGAASSGPPPPTRWWGPTSPTRGTAARALPSNVDTAVSPAPELPGPWSAGSVARVVAVVPGQAPSPYQGAPWGEVLDHICRRLSWTNPGFEMRVVREEQLLVEEGVVRLQELLGTGAQVMVATGITHPVVISLLGGLGAQGRLPAIRLFMPGTPSGGNATYAASSPLSDSTTGAGAGITRSSSSLTEQGLTLERLSSLGGWAPMAGHSSLLSTLSRALPFTPAAKGQEVWKTVQELWHRGTTDDLLFVFLVLLNQYVTPVKEVSMTTKGLDLASLTCMLTKCWPQISACINNPVCKAGLDCLQACAFNDQVAQYRCIVSHESREFAEFALCNLQLHNCRSLSADIPALPEVAPMTSFRGTPLTHETAEDLFIAWLDPTTSGAGPKSSKLPFSWLVAAGKNAAYDSFPCQHQLFYRGKGKAFWYEPVFKVITLQGQAVWRRRKYRVRRGSAPGTFYFTVLDNGVTSNEFWRIVDCDEGLEWCLFYYSGAASAAGLSYTGAVVATRDGRMPAGDAANARLEAALERSGIKMFELSYVDNSNCAEGAPLGLAV